MGGTPLMETSFLQQQRKMKDVRIFQDLIICRPGRDRTCVSTIPERRGTPEGGSSGKFGRALGLWKKYEQID